MSYYRRRYSRELKLEVIRRVQETGRSQAQVARRVRPPWISRLRREKGPRGPWSVSRRHGGRIDNPASSSV